MLPQTDNPPSEPTKATVVSAIPAAISINFCLPFFGELAAPLRKSPPVPEIAINEDGNFLLPEDKIRPSWQIPGMAFPRKATFGQGGHHLLLRTGICSLDPGHDGAALLDGHDVTLMPSRFG